MRGLFVLESQLFEKDQVQYDELFTTRALDRPRPGETQLQANRRTTEAFWKHWSRDGWIQDGLLVRFRQLGVTHVRVPIGYWMFEDSVGHNRTRDGFVHGSLPKLVEFVQRAVYYNMKVILVFTALPGGQRCCSTTTGRQTCATTNIYGPFTGGEVPDFFSTWASTSVEDPSRITTCGVEYGNEHHPIQPQSAAQTPSATCGDVLPNFFTDSPDNFLSSTYTDDQSTYHTTQIYNTFYPTRNGQGCPSLQVQPSTDIWCKKDWTDPRTSVQWDDTRRSYNLCPMLEMQQRAYDALDQLLHEIYHGSLNPFIDDLYVVPYANMAQGSNNALINDELKDAIGSYALLAMSLLKNYYNKSATKNVKWMLNDEGLGIFHVSSDNDVSTLPWMIIYMQNANMELESNPFGFHGFETSTSFNYGHQMPVDTGIRHDAYSTNMTDLKTCLITSTSDICTAKIEAFATGGLAHLVWTNLFSSPVPQTFDFMRYSGDAWRWSRVSDGKAHGQPMWVRVSFGKGGFTAPPQLAISDIVSQVLLLLTILEMFKGGKPYLVLDTARAGEAYRFHTGLMPNAHHESVNFNTGMDSTPPSSDHQPWHFPLQSSIGALMYDGRLFDPKVLTGSSEFGPFGYLNQA